MKKIFFAGALALFGAMNAQSTTGLKAGLHLGLPTGDMADAYSFNLGADVAYLAPITAEFRLGGATGYSHFFGKEVTSPSINIGGYVIPSVSAKVKDAGIIPVAVAAEYDLAKNFFVGADLGYAFSTEKDGKGAFYYQPKVGYQLSKVDLTLSYKGFSRDGENAGAINLGAAYKF